MNIRPLYDNVVIKREEQEAVSAGGIVLPGSAKEQPNQGEVVAVGDGALQDNGEIRALEVKVGDTVVFGQYSGNTIKVDGDELMIMRENEIFGIIG
ncbi:MAG: co-chaperone GroES [Pseudomonadales bacterium]|nr:co-chaperone GroES [Pseudomonadales bacterium]